MAYPCVAWRYSSPLALWTKEKSDFAKILYKNIRRQPEAHERDMTQVFANHFIPSFFVFTLVFLSETLGTKPYCATQRTLKPRYLMPLRCG